MKASALRSFVSRLGLVAIGIGAGCARQAGSTEAAEAHSGEPVLLATSAAPPSQDVPRVQIPASVEQSCRDICEHSRRLKCGNAEECMGNCVAMGSLIPCKDEVISFYGCLLREPVEHWECADDGVAAIREGFCDREQKQTLACMEKKMN